MSKTINFALDNNFYQLEPRQQQAKRIATLDEIAAKFGAIARDVIKSIYDWTEMSPMQLWNAANIRDWTVQR